MKKFNWANLARERVMPMKDDDFPKLLAKINWSFLLFLAAVLSFALAFLFATLAKAQVPAGSTWYCGTFQTIDSVASTYVSKEKALAINGNRVYLVYDFGYTPQTYTIYSGDIFEISAPSGFNSYFMVKLRNSRRQNYEVGISTYYTAFRSSEISLYNIFLAGSGVSFLSTEDRLAVSNLTMGECSTSLMRGRL